MIRTYWMDSSKLPDLNEDPAEWEACLRRLSKERSEKIRRIRHPDSRKQSLGAGLLLQEALSRLAPDTEIMYLPYGKPVCKQVPFNLSHTKDRVVLSIWDGSQTFVKEDSHYLIGCDIEPVRPCQLRVARRFFTQSESHSLEAETNPQIQDRLFCRYWTKKESVLKLTGLGISLPMHLFDVQGSQVKADQDQIGIWSSKASEHIQEEKRKEIQKAAGILQKKQIFFKEYDLQGYCVTVCSLTDCFCPDIQRYTFERA